jgi:DNA-binding response OmpR family regulator
MKILLVEDHQEIAGIIFDFFEIKGFQLDYARDGLQGFELANSNHYDVIILDVMLPHLDGLSVCQKLRKHGIDTPILMLTARDSNNDILDGFEHGADDYLVKPFDLNILAARLNALYKRKSGNAATKAITFSNLTLDLASRTLRRNECTFQLNQTLFTIMKTLMLRAPDIASRDEIINQVWQDDSPEDDVLRHHIYQLRSQIDKPFKHAYIHTIPKVGYQLKLES